MCSGYTDGGWIGTSYPKEARMKCRVERQYEKYEHHGKEVWVRSDLKGEHREHCLCFDCQKLDIEDPEKNCPKASRLYQLCVEEDMVTPVWECPEFEPNE